MTVILTTAKPYAKAIFDLALNQNALTDNLRYLKQLANFVLEAQKNYDLDGPLINPKKKLELFSDFTSSSKHIENLIKLLIRRKKLSLIPDIALSFQQIFFDHKNVIQIKVVSAKKLDGDQKRKILESLEKKYSSKILLHCSIDESLIGGAIIYVGDEVIDSSMKGMLFRLKQNLLKKNAYDKT